MVEQSEVAEADETEATTRKRKMDRFDTGRRGLKSKLRGGRGGKRMRMVEQQRPSRHVEPPKEAVPIICDLCNVKCDTQAVFDCHLAGKKHLSKLKRFQGHQAMYGPVGLQALYPPNPNTQSIFVPQVQHHQQPIYIPPQQQMMAYGPPQGQQIAAAAAASEPKVSLDSEMQQGPQVTPGGGQLAGSVEPEGQQQGAAAATLEQEGQQTVGTTSQNGVSESEVKVVTDPPLQQQSVVVPSSEDAELASQTSNVVVSKIEYGVSSSSSENVTLPGHEMKTEQKHIEYSIKSEGPAAEEPKEQEMECGVDEKRDQQKPSWWRLLPVCGSGWSPGPLGWVPSPIKTSSMVLPCVLFNIIQT
ncbi:zinc finger protein [Macleaya cordata]|uniref:Zinc finger protein n=1 Tax=Macleaya cordata TaxID=56857 RepID=A0A200R0D4_MACCD|nr:zinc finger protein [Macleaya cordata]